MKRVGKIAVCLAGGLALNAGLRAESVVLPNNPYAQIVARNVFDLNPPPKFDPSAAQKADPPPKITPNGIMDVFGHLQVLFKAPDSGKPPKDNSYILSEGQRQDDIEVMKIDEKAGLVTFNNHGTVQELALASTPASSAPAATMRPNIPIPNFHPNGNNGNRFGGPGNFGGNGGNFGRLNRGGGNGGNNPNGSTGGNYSAQSQQPTITPEQQVIMIEAQRMQYQNENNPIAKLLPITAMTPPDGNEGDSQTPP
jgi:hypothetical protein